MDSAPRRNPEEWDLVHLLLQSQLTPTQVHALTAEVFTEPACRRIVEIALRHLDHDGRVLIPSVLDEAADDPECGSAVMELSVAERHFEEVAAHAAGCLAKLERKRWERMFSELIVKLRAAEQEGRTEEVCLLNAQVNELRISKAALASPRTNRCSP